MKVKVVASTKMGYQAPMEELNHLAGESAGICYMKEDFETLYNEPLEKSLTRCERTKERTHHSVCSHGVVSFDLENVPKLFAMLLNNEKMYNTSERSARYRRMKLEGMEKFLYEKWLKIFIDIITVKYGNHPFFNETIIRTLAQENARYMTSVMTPTSMRYTVDVRQLNYMCGWMQEFETSTNPLYKMLAPTANEFLNFVDSFGYLDPLLLKDGKGREFSLIGKRIREEQFGECYSVNYDISFAAYAQAQRHRTLHYEMMLDKNPECFIPLILLDNPYLVEEWIRDFEAVAHVIPQGQLIHVNERGDYENLILKAKERLCTAAQLEVMRNTHNTLERIVKSTNNEYVKAELEPYTHGARCVNGFKCTTPCAFKQGIDLTRDI